MVEPFEEGLSGARENVEDFSDKALYPYLKIHIFGPYQGDCENYLRAVAHGLQERGFEKARICSDVEGRPPEDATREEKAAYWKEKSYDFLEHADVAVFFFLRNTLDRSETLPDYAFNGDQFVNNLPEDKDIADVEREVQDLNASPHQELVHWCNRLNQPPERTMALFEETCFNRIGPIFADDVRSAGMFLEEELPDYNVEKAITRVRGIAQDWVSNYCKLLLQKRYHKDQVNQ